MSFEKNIQVNTQNKIHQNNILRNFQAHKIYVSPVTIHHSKITPNITKNTATAVPSLNKLSHSKISASFLGAQILLNIDNTATGSVEEINTQNNKQMINGISKPTSGNTKNNHHAIIMAEMSKPKIAKEVIDFQLFIKCL